MSQTQKITDYWISLAKPRSGYTPKSDILIDLVSSLWNQFELTDSTQEAFEKYLKLEVLIEIYKTNPLPMELKEKFLNYFNVLPLIELSEPEQKDWVLIPHYHIQLAIEKFIPKVIQYLPVAQIEAQQEFLEKVIKENLKDKIEPQFKI